MKTDLQKDVEEIIPEIVALRHELHSHPELRFEEHWTSKRIADFLSALDIPYTSGHAGGTGIVAQIDGNASGGMVALRADMDGLEIPEATGMPYASVVKGCMHACGHDGHVACLCGVAKVLARHRDCLPNRVKLIFQPAEELGAGGRRIVEEGVLEGVDAVFALHVWPGLPLGSIGTRPGPLMASADNFSVEIHGRGCHGADPASGVDPVVVAAQIVTALQTIVSRELNPWDAGVVTVGRIESGFATNIIPETALIEGTYRALTPEVRSTISGAIRRLSESIAQAFRATSIVHLAGDGYAALINDPAMVAYAQETVAATLGPEAAITVQAPSMAAEDFAFYLQHTPGALLWIGAGKDSTPLHNAHFDFPDAVLVPGIETLVNLAWQYRRP